MLAQNLTGKYTRYNFLLKNLSEQFSRMANVYFLIISVLTSLPISPKDPFSLIGTFVFVLTLSAVKEAYEDVQRHKSDEEANQQKCRVVAGGKEEEKIWRNVEVGDIMKISKDDPIPADMIILSTTDTHHGLCFIDTCNIDGETNLKTMNAMECSKHIKEDEEVKDLKFDVECELPNPSLYTFSGSADTNLATDKVSVSVNNVLLRGCVLRQTKNVYGAVIFTGHDTKLYKNASTAPFKVSYLMKMMNRCLILVFSFQGIICATNTFFAKRFLDSEVGKNQVYASNPFFLANDPNFNFNSKLELGIGFEIETWLTFVVAYSNLIPISLYVALELVKLFQVVLINNDKEMYHEETDTPTNARTSNLVEELGQVKFIFSDKTGTLTCNVMEFACCSIAGQKFHTTTSFESASSMFLDSKKFKDMGGEANFPQRLFWKLLAVCHTVLAEYPEGEEPDLNKVKYQAASPDEAALVSAAKEMGYGFLKGTPVLYQIQNEYSGEVEQWEILMVIEFNSTRKRMSVVCKSPEGKTLLLCKGADNIIVERLKEQVQTPGDEHLSPLAETNEHLGEFAEIGLRTLCLAYKELNEEEFKDVNEKWYQASLSIDNKDELQDKLAEEVERDLILVGATAIEDKLQDGVPEAIETLADAGIKLWVLTGDKQETAINIGFSCRLLVQDMNIHILSGAKTVSELKQHIMEIMMKDLKDGENEDVKRAIVVDGATLTLALHEDVKSQFLEFGLMCDVCICCRVSPKQKAEVVRLVKDMVVTPPVITLAIGDGANDVSMIQAAHIGIGISGQEGMQAVRASDFSIAQFRFLVRLLLVHGGWAYKRVAKFILFYFYKNMMNVFTEYFFAFQTSFSGQILFADWLSIGYNAAYSSFGCIFGFCLDQDVNAMTIMKNPRLYEFSMFGMGFDMYKFFGWMMLAFWHAAICYFVPMHYMNDAKADDGIMMGHWFHGTTSFIALILVVHLKLGVMVYSWNYLVYAGIGVSLLLFFVTFMILCTYWMSTGTLAWQEEMLGMSTLLFSTPKFWLCIFITSFTAIVPDFLMKYTQSNYAPFPHNIFHEIEMGHTVNGYFKPEKRSKSNITPGA
ncbi:hypothetical protein TL16_g10823 [Triparma laevis f. inornata]|uniref:Phospholipid-transporting ATPase n=1 Tax=Triparma laevis f. inornata TaxID=1714386 RepID=A0A9W7ENN0_9STRA|nr:hypothetical protein TL16_g10823 [Triparma laevis f. inornata]